MNDLWFFYRPDTGSALSFGLCVPAACSMNFLQNYVDHINSKKVTIKLIEKSCQLEEYASELTTLDWITA